RRDPGVGAPVAVVVGALRALPRRVRTLAVRLPLPVPQHHRRPPRPPRPRLRRRHPPRVGAAVRGRAPRHPARGRRHDASEPAAGAGPGRGRVGGGACRRVRPARRHRAGAGGGRGRGAAGRGPRGRCVHPHPALRGGAPGARAHGGPGRPAGRRAHGGPLRTGRPGGRRVSAPSSTAPVAGDGRAVPAALFDPRGIAVVGASREPAKLGAVMARSLAAFLGPVALVNPRDGAMAPSVAAAAGEHGPIDLAVLCVPAAATAGALADAAAGGVRAAVVGGGGFAEAGPEGERHRRALARTAAETGVRVLGPNTSGFLAPGRGLTASFVPGAAAVPAGRIAVVAASGGVNHALAFLLAEAGHGVSLAVGLGNAIDVDAPDVLDHLARDPDTTAVALHVESVADGPRLTAAVARLAARKPVVALVVGRHDVGAFARSHTGALATSWRTTRAALRQAGAVLVDSERELVDAVAALSLVRLPPGASGVGVLTAQAGPGLLLLDDLRGRGVDVPELTPTTQAAVAELLPPLTYQRNPVDTGRPGPEFAAVLRAVAADPGVDVVAAYALHEPDAVDLAAAVDAARPGVPLVVGVGGTGPQVQAARRALLARGIPALADPTGVAAAVHALLSDARRRDGGPAAPGSLDGHLRTISLGPGPWDEDA